MQFQQSRRKFGECSTKGVEFQRGLLDFGQECAGSIFEGLTVVEVDSHHLPELVEGEDQRGEIASDDTDECRFRHQNWWWAEFHLTFRTDWCSKLASLRVSSQLGAAILSEVISSAKRTGTIRIVPYVPLFLEMDISDECRVGQVYMHLRF